MASLSLSLFKALETVEDFHAPLLLPPSQIISWNDHQSLPCRSELHGRPANLSVLVGFFFFLKKVPVWPPLLLSFTVREGLVL